MVRVEAVSGHASHASKAAAAHTIFSALLTDTN